MPWCPCYCHFKIVIRDVVSAEPPCGECTCSCVAALSSSPAEASAAAPAAGPPAAPCIAASRHVGYINFKHGVRLQACHQALASQLPQQSVRAWQVDDFTGWVVQLRLARRPPCDVFDLVPPPAICARPRTTGNADRQIRQSCTAGTACTSSSEGVEPEGGAASSG